MSKKFFNDLALTGKSNPAKQFKISSSGTPTQQQPKKSLR